MEETIFLIKRNDKQLIIEKEGGRIPLLSVLLAACIVDKGVVELFKECISLYESPSMQDAAKRWGEENSEEHGDDAFKAK